MKATLVAFFVTNFTTFFSFSQHTKLGTFARHTKLTHISQPCKRACLVPTLLGHTLLWWTHTLLMTHPKERRTYNREFAAMLADE
ncbi:MAG: hypothetical protein EOO10_11005 [Chitinophagaceae bacterium]|nr:MAG: hypothetical protein EOO10_11005 [Chitinophagaceae bacterium]